MDTEAVEVRVIARVSAVLLALVGGTLLSSVEVEPAAQAGDGLTASIEVIRKKPAETALPAAASGRAEAAAFAEMANGEGMGEEIRLWVTGPSGELIFRNADRYQRCLVARSRRIEAPDCPSAADRRRMVLDEDGADPRGA